MYFMTKIPLRHGIRLWHMAAVESKGKPVVRRGRKASGLVKAKTAGLPARPLS
jgi:hypothetical protein